jgi:PAS domain S-box-containing protein
MPLIRKGPGKLHSPRQSLRTPTDEILESISDGVFTVDPSWHITTFNRAAEEITGISRRDAIGRLCCDVFRAEICESGCALRQTFETKRPIINQSIFIISADGRRIPISVSTAILRDENGKILGGAETFRDLSLVEELRRELEGRSQVGDMVSHNPALRKIFDILPAVAVSDSSVLIEGETGTGKEVLARTIHALSRRAAKPFVGLNCGALPDTLLESELFGYKAGAFTGASHDKPGRFAQAENGTLLLDEIGDISPALQVRLLRVLQEKSYEPLGSTKSVKTNVRMISATHRNLANLIESGEFRRDLFYRINVVRLVLPPLRRRREDIPLLTEHFIQKFNRLKGRNIPGISPDTRAIFQSYSWPGNIRELENILEYAFVVCEHGPIQPHHLPELMIAGKPFPVVSAGLREAKSATEAQILLRVLEKNHFDRTATAQELGIHRSTFFRKVRALGLKFPAVDGRTKA